MIPFIAVLAAAALAHRSAAAAVPAAAPGFVVEDAIPGSHIEAPVGLAFTPEGRLLVADVPGRVWVIENGVQLPTPMWAAENEVEINGDCGLLGMALSPQFASNREIFLLYSVDPDSNGVDDDSVHFGRLVRYQVSASDPRRIDLSTRTVLLGCSWHDGVLNASGTHDIGSLRFAEDGTLLVSTGEGAQYTQVDPGGLDPALFAPGRGDSVFDRGAFRAQQRECPGGKILRIDPATGHGLPSNPGWNGDPDAVVSKVWASGFRNPFRFCVRPGTGSADPAQARPGALYVGDVGWNLWEELDVVTKPAQDFGWPCREGPRANPPYDALAPAFGGCAGASPFTEPVLAFSHVSADSSAPFAMRANAMIGGTFYTASEFPAPWRGRLVFGDYYRGWVAGADFDSQQHYVGADILATGMNGPVDYAVEPATGWLYVACIDDDHVRRIRWSPTLAVEPGAHALALSAAWPSPANGAVSFALTLPRDSEVSFEIVDATGRRVWRDAPAHMAAGTHPLRWDGSGRGGRPAPSGLYFACVRGAGETLVRRIARVR